MCLTPGSQKLIVIISQCVLLFSCSLCGNNVGVAGAQALAGGLQHYTNLQDLK